MRAVKFTISGLTFALAASCALSLLHLFSPIFNITGQDLYFAAIALLSSFVIGGYYGSALLMTKKISAKELIRLGMEIPIRSVILAGCLIGLWSFIFRLVQNLSTNSGFTLVYVLLLDPIVGVVYAVISVIFGLTTSPVILPIGILAAFILRRAYMVVAAEELQSFEIKS